jgi:site-specific DNA-methyltransferase (adenine-specific)
MIELYNMDCMEAMKKMKDNEFDLAIVDPPYGIGISSNPVKGNNTLKRNGTAKHQKRNTFNELKRFF